MGGLGSVERIVEIHDRGVFRESFGLGADEATSPKFTSRDRPSLFRTRSEAARMAAVELSCDEGEGGLQQPLIPPSLSIDPQSIRSIHGVRLHDIHIAMRSKTDHLLLNGVDFEVLGGQVALILGSDAAKSNLLSTLMLKMTPCRGIISYQSSDESWSAFDFRRDDAAPWRRRIGFCSASSIGIFRTSAGDNIAVAAPETTRGEEVRRVAQMVGLHDEIMAMTDGYRSLLGEGSGRAISRATALRIGLARALIRRPQLLLIDDAELFIDAVGPEPFYSILSFVIRGGGLVVMCHAGLMLPTTLHLDLGVKAYELKDGMMIKRSI